MDTKFSISSSDGTNLQFQSISMYKSYKLDELLLNLKYYKEIRDQHGIWASNQNKFVSDISELNDWDGKYMEVMYAKYKEQL